MTEGISIPVETEPQVSEISPAEKLMLLDDLTRCLEVIDLQKPEMLYALDRSARPLLWLIKEYLKNDPPLQFRFLNVGSEKTGTFNYTLNHLEDSELAKSKRFHPNKIMIIDDRASSEGSLNNAKTVVQKLYNLPEDRVTTYSVLSMYPSWYGNATKIGVNDPPSRATNLLAQRTLDVQIAPSEYQLISQLRKRVINITQVDTYLKGLELPELERSRIKQRIILLSDTTRTVTLQENDELIEGEAVYNNERSKLWKEITALAGNLDRFHGKYQEFRQIEDEVTKKNSSSFNDLPKSFLTWDSTKGIYICNAEELMQLADRIDTAELDLKFGMKLYYLIKHNIICPSDWTKGIIHFLDLDSPSLNYLADKILQKI